jgi:hypothetical protein
MAQHWKQGKRVIVPLVLALHFELLTTSEDG